MSARRRPPEGRRGAEQPAHTKVAVLGAILLTLTAIVGMVGTVSMRSIEHDLGFVVEDDGRVLQELRALHRLVLQGQLALEQATVASVEERAALLGAFDESIDAAVDRWDRATAPQDGGGLDTDPDAFDDWVTHASTLRARLAAGAEDVDLDDVRASFAELTASFEAQTVPLVEEVETTAQDALARAELAHRVLLLVAAFGLVAGAVAIRSTYRAARRQHEEIARRDAERAAEAAQGRVEARVAQAFDYARTDTDVLRAAEQALAELHPARPTELLLADSSRAHFTVGLRTGDDGRPGCGVRTPSDCPAAARGQTLTFPTSERFDACPHLKDRPQGPLSAVCIPVSISGTAEGVLHSTGEDGEEPDDATRHTLGLVAARAGDRIGVLRAFDLSQAQAATDPLTGLANRRSFENRVGAILEGGGTVAIAFGDLDHFKHLNDTHGHDTGDRALRAFARTFRQTVRPGDVVARWGGEEFVAAFPDTTGPALVEILDRVRLELAALVSGGEIPAFTVSFGVADGDDAPDLAGLVAAADRALLAAKRTGRNRIVLASAALAGDAPG